MQELKSKRLRFTAGVDCKWFKVGEAKRLGEGRGGSDGCFVFTSWLAGAFDHFFWNFLSIHL